jgi:hypothetical protein
MSVGAWRAPQPGDVRGEQFTPGSVEAWIGANSIEHAADGLSLPTASRPRRTGRRRVLRLAREVVPQQQAGQLGAGPDAELAVRACQVGFNGLA